MTYPLPKFITHRVGHPKVIFYWRFITPLFDKMSARHRLVKWVEWYTGKKFGDKGWNKEMDKRGIY